MTATTLQAADCLYRLSHCDREPPPGARALLSVKPCLVSHHNLDYQLGPRRQGKRNAKPAAGLDAVEQLTAASRQMQRARQPKQGTTKPGRRSH